MDQKIIIGLVSLFSMGILFFSFSDRSKNISVEPIKTNSAVQTENDLQVITIVAYGGYTPHKISAKAGIKSRLDIKTKGTYDCSSALVIPSLNFKKNLPPFGVTSINLPAQAKGSKITGLCSMGMFFFDINFE
ncbi:cupredoxin domain-containing protein [Patescibacteria group bacterium]|nr:cupredoxin domain-containing protein [Patescibacteria group bacterium]